VLVDEFVRVCGDEGWDVDERGDFDYDPAEEEEAVKVQGENRQKREVAYKERLKSVDRSHGGGRVGIFKVSHIGGKYLMYCESAIFYREEGTDLFHFVVSRTQICWKRHRVSAQRRKCVVWPSYASRCRTNRMLYYYYFAPLIVILTVECLQVKETLKEGRVIQELLRGGIGLTGKKESLLEW
jgi:hypothetical protein